MRSQGVASLSLSQYFPRRVLRVFLYHGYHHLCPATSMFILFLFLRPNPFVGEGLRELLQLCARELQGRISLANWSVLWASSNILADS